MFDPQNPATWQPREARSEQGTLLCICGRPGLEFFVDGTEEREGRTFGILRGACSEEHWALYRAHTREEEFDPMACFAEPAPEQDFGPLFSKGE